MPYRPHPLLQFLGLVAIRFREDQCIRLASSLAFTTLLSLVPLVTIMLTLFTAFPVFSEFMGHVDDFVTEHMLPQEIGKGIRGYFEQFSSNAGRLTALGTAFLALIAFLLMVTVERAFNSIWRVRRQRPIAQRVMMYWAILTLGPVLIGASVSMTTYLLSISLGWAGDVPAVQQAVLRLVPFVFTIAAFTLLYLAVPSRPVRMQHALIGGVVAGILFELMKRGFALYVANLSSYAVVYGAFAIVPIFLIWIYLSWLVALLGAVVAALLPDWKTRRGTAAMVPGMTFADALAVVRVLMSAQSRAETLDDRVISRAAGVPAERCDAVLGELAQAGWVARAGEQRWVLVCDTENLKVSDLFRRFVLSSDQLKDRLEQESSVSLTSALDRFEAELDVPIRDLVQRLRTERAPVTELALRNPKLGKLSSAEEKH